MELTVELKYIQVDIQVYICQALLEPDPMDLEFPIRLLKAVFPLCRLPSTPLAAVF